MAVKHTVQLIALTLILALSSPVWAQFPTLGGELAPRPIPTFGGGQVTPLQIKDGEAFYKCTNNKVTYEIILCRCPDQTITFGSWTCTRINQDCKKCGTIPRVKNSPLSLAQDLLALSRFEDPSLSATVRREGGHCPTLPGSSLGLSRLGAPLFQSTAEILVNQVLTAEECWSQGGTYFSDDLAYNLTHCHIPLILDDPAP